MLLGKKLSQALGDTTLGTSLRRGSARRSSYYCTMDSLLSHKVQPALIEGFGKKSCKEQGSSTKIFALIVRYG